MASDNNATITFPTCEKEVVHLTATIERKPDTTDPCKPKRNYCKFSTQMNSNVNTLNPTMILWDQEIYNSGCFKKISDSIIQAKKAGLYFINVNANFNTNGKGTFRIALRILVNGKNTAASSALGFIISKNNEQKQWSNTLGDYFEFDVDDVISISLYRLEDGGNVYLLPGQTFLSIVEQ